MGLVKIGLSAVIIVLVLLFVIFSVNSLTSTTVDDDENNLIDFVDDVINNNDTEDTAQKVILLKNEDLSSVQSCIYKFDTGANIVTARCEGYTDEYIAGVPVCHQLRHDSIDDYFGFVAFNEHICDEMGLYWYENDINQGCYYTIDLVDEDMKPVNFNFVAGSASYTGYLKNLRASDYYFDKENYRMCILPDSVVDSGGKKVKYKINAFLNTEKGLS